jgi:DNA mismatch repair protein MutL
MRMNVPRIRVLPPELADQIAAGEVVERPASVVKELAENALDAGARRIDVEVERGGLGLIAVSDDGCGMTPEEAHLALKRHATSKLRAIDDLFTLSSMGFRGEALPSIAAVSHFQLTTRAAGAPDGEGAYLLTVSGGAAGEGRHVGAPVGTRIEVRDLFGNVPARLKFVKSEATEAAQIAETMLRLALAFPAVHFRLRSGGRLTHDLPPHASGLERARVALGRGRTPAQLHPAGGEEGGVAVAGYLGSPAESANTSRGTYLFVNGRFVRDRSLLHAVTMGYGETLERGRYPLCVVHLTVAGDAVDVNVHPQKLEVRFARPQEVYAAVRHTLAAAVANAPWLSEPAGAAVTVYSLPPSRSFAREAGRANGAGDESRAGGEPWRGRGEAGGSGRSETLPLSMEERRRRAEEAMRMFAPPLEPLFREPPADAGAAASNTGSNLRTAVQTAEEPHAGDHRDGFFSSLIYLGQLQRTYLVCQAPGELVLIDQHAAHERVAFQRLREAHSSRRARGQRLLLPARVELEPQVAAMAAEHAPLLAELGFELEPFGDRTVVVRALPQMLADADPAEVVAEALGELEARAATELVADKLDHLLATMACHSVVRAGDLLSSEEVRALLVSMDGIDYRAHCPHGRPVLLRLSIGEIERRFGRA